MELFKLLVVGKGNKVGRVEVLPCFELCSLCIRALWPYTQRLVHLLSTAGCNAEVSKLAEDI